MDNGPQRIFDTHLRALHRARAAARGGERPLWVEAEGGLQDRLRPVTRDFATALTLEPGLDALAGFAATWTQGGFDAEETLTVSGTYDLIVSRLSLHGLNDLPGALVQIRRALNPGGLFLAALFGGETLHELRAALGAGETLTCGRARPRVAPFADVRDLGMLLRRAGFVDAVADGERTLVRYRKLDTLVSDLRDMGEGGAFVARAPLTRAAWAAATAAYAEAPTAAPTAAPSAAPSAAPNAAPGSDRCFPATFDIVYLTGWVRGRRTSTPAK